MTYRHPPGHCDSVQCALCWNLIDPSKPLLRDGVCGCGQPAESGDLCGNCRNPSP